MLPFMGPGLNSDICIVRSLNCVGWCLPVSSLWPGLSIWNTPRVFVVRICLKVSASSLEMASRSMLFLETRSISLIA